MTCGCSKDKDIDVVDISQVPIDTLNDLPQYLLAERDVADELSGDVVRTLTRIPTKRIVPNGNLDNIFAVVANNDELTVPEGQVKAVAIANLGSSYSVVEASDEHPTMFIMIGRDGGNVLAQSCGVASILCGHDYILGQDYWAGEDGEPVTSATSGQHLFTPISKTQLLIQLYRVNNS